MTIFANVWISRYISKFYCVYTYGKTLNVCIEMYLRTGVSESVLRFFRGPIAISAVRFASLCLISSISACWSYNANTGKVTAVMIQHTELPWWWYNTCKLLLWQQHSHKLVTVMMPQLTQIVSGETTQTATLVSNTHAKALPQWCRCENQI